MARPRVGTDGFVYFVRADEVNRVKIGFSTSPEERIAALKTGSPCSLTLIGSVPGNQADETALHQLLRSHRCDGEWFDYSVTVRRVIEFCVKSNSANAEPYLVLQVQQFELRSYHALVDVLRSDPGWQVGVPEWATNGIVELCDACAKRVQSNEYPTSTVSLEHASEVMVLHQLILFVAQYCACNESGWVSAAEKASSLAQAIITGTRYQPDVTNTALSILDRLEAAS